MPRWTTAANTERLRTDSSGGFCFPHRWRRWATKPVSAENCCTLQLTSHDQNYWSDWELKTKCSGIFFLNIFLCETDSYHCVDLWSLGQKEKLLEQWIMFVALLQQTSCKCNLQNLFCRQNWVEIKLCLGQHFLCWHAFFPLPRWDYDQLLCFD